MRVLQVPLSIERITRETVPLPSVVGADDPAGTRFAVTAAVGFAGIIGFFAQRPRPIPENIAANREILSGWRDEYDAAVRENQALLEDMRLRIQSGTPARIERERP